VGTNKRYADSIDERAAQRVAGGPHQSERRPQSGGPHQSERQPQSERRPQSGGPHQSERQPQSERPPQQPLRDWQTPWPPIRVGEVEWIVMRQSKTEPAAVIRVIKMGPRNETFYRVVTWAPASDARSLVGYYTTLAEADRAVMFAPGDVTPK